MPTAPSRWTLRTKLLASVLALFAVVMLATSALTVLVTRSYLTAPARPRTSSGATDRVSDARPGGFDERRRRPRGRAAARSALPGAATCSSSG